MEPAGVAPTQQPAGRVCDSEDCSTVLSRYNPSSTCTTCERRRKADPLGTLAERVKRRR